MLVFGAIRATVKSQPTKAYSLLALGKACLTIKEKVAVYTKGWYGVKTSFCLELLEEEEYFR